jgi:hypothetical protein
MQRRCWYLEMADPKKRLIRSDRGLSDLEIISRSQLLSDPVGSRPELERVAIGLLERLMPAPQAGLCKDRAADACSAVLEPLQIAEGAYLPQGVAGTSRWGQWGIAPLHSGGIRTIAISRNITINHACGKWSRRR